MPLRVGSRLKNPLYENPGADDATTHSSFSLTSLSRVCMASMQMSFITDSGVREERRFEKNIFLSFVSLIGLTITRAKVRIHIKEQ